MLKSETNLLDLLSETPPWMIRLMAVEPTDDPAMPVRSITLPKLAARSGLSYRNFQRIAWRDDWQGVEVQFVSQFFQGCGVNMLTAKTDFETFVATHAAYLMKLTPRWMPKARLKVLKGLIAKT